jgi:hypothetical protein
MSGCLTPAVPQHQPKPVIKVKIISVTGTDAQGNTVIYYSDNSVT